MTLIKLLEKTYPFLQFHNVEFVDSINHNGRSVQGSYYTEFDKIEIVKSDNKYTTMGIIIHEAIHRKIGFVVEFVDGIHGELFQKLCNVCGLDVWAEIPDNIEIVVDPEARGMHFIDQIRATQAKSNQT